MLATSSSAPSILPIPPISTLFPYTTLFRSDTKSAAGAIFRCYLQGILQITEFAPLGNGCLESIRSVVDGTAVVDLGAKDRKSTRLNSSHVSISYAVFCLKKKNKNKTP